MASIQFYTGSATTNGHAAQLIVDGVDITNHVLHDGFWIGPSNDGPDAEWTVHLALAAEAIEANLPDALVQAVVADEDVA